MPQRRDVPRAGFGQRLARFCELREGRLDYWDAAAEIGVDEASTGRRYERWYQSRPDLGGGVMASDRQVAEHRQRAAREAAAAQAARLSAEAAEAAQQAGLADAGTNQDPLPEGRTCPRTGRCEEW
jgi:hypothetical protein